MIGMFLSYGIAGLVGFLTGVTVQFGYLKAHGKRIVLPFISNSSRTITMAAIGLALLSLFTIVQVERSDAERTSCQTQFQEALAYNTMLNKQDRDLATRERAASAESRDAIGDLILDITGVYGRTPPATQEETLQIFGVYNQRQAAVTEEFAQVDRDREEINTKRAPYPEPACGK